MLVEEAGETFAYTFMGTWLLGYDFGMPDGDRSSGQMLVWSIARGEKGKYVTYSRDFGHNDTTGKVIVTETYQEFESKIPPAHLPGAAGRARSAGAGKLPPERPLDV